MTRHGAMTVAQLVDACLPPDPETASLWRRRVRIFAVMGALRPDRPAPGTGRAREFGADSVFLAALLLRLADAGYPMASMAAVGRLITAPRRTKDERAFREFWHQAKAPANGADAYLALTSWRRDPDAIAYRFGWGPIGLEDSGAWAVINLSLLFGELTEAEG